MWSLCSPGLRTVMRTWLVVGFLYGYVLAGLSDNTLEGLPPPESVQVEVVSENSVTVKWQHPRSLTAATVKLFAYVVVYSPVGTHGQEEKELLLPPTLTSTVLKELDSDRQYSVVVSAIYTGYARAPAPKILVAMQHHRGGTGKDHTLGRPVQDDVYPEKEPECNCSAVGMVACMRTSHTFRCSCFPGYDGEWCHRCAPGFFRSAKECIPCPCSNVTSSAICLHDSKTGATSCESCLPGHRGPDCRSCSAGYHWKGDRCQPVNCLSFSLCAEEKDAPGCADCVFLEESVPANAQKSNAERGLGDGTVPLVAVIVTLAVIVLVAAAATCYRYWSRQQTRGPRIPFWSIELREEKLNLGADCQYQHLDASRAALHDHSGDVDPGVDKNTVAATVSV